MGQSARRSVLALCLLLGVGCSNSETFNCQDDAGCGANGQCEGNGFCSFPDAECESGRRYGDLAGAGLQGQCVAVNEGSTGFSGSEDSTTSSTASTTGPPSFTTSQVGSSTGGTSGQADSSTGQTCEISVVDVPTVPADIVVLVGPDIDANAVMPAVSSLIAADDNNIALIVPDDFITDSLDPECPAGCVPGCPSNPSTLVFSYDGDQSPYDPLSSFSNFDCIFREPSPDSSAPVANLLFMTENPGEMPPPDFASLILDGGRPLRAHVSCPGCDQDLFNANAVLEDVVLNSGGTVSDATVVTEIVSQAEHIGAERRSCTWSTSTDSDILIFLPSIGDEFFANRVAGIGDCGTEPLPPGDFGQFYGTDVGVSLCPQTCRLLQAYPAVTIEIAECG